jgi:hypothetical protein
MRVDRVNDGELTVGAFLRLIAPVTVACVACSIKREIGHLCHDERKPKASEKPPVVPPPTPTNVELPKNYPGALSLNIAGSGKSSVLYRKLQPACAAHIQLDLANACIA